jgi:hypothetical protein
VDQVEAVLLVYLVAIMEQLILAAVLVHHVMYQVLVVMAVQALL